MTMVRMDVESIVIGNKHVASMLILHPRDTSNYSSGLKLPIRIGLSEAMSMQDATQNTKHKRPMTHDLLLNTITKLGGTVSSVCINDVEGRTFFADISIIMDSGETITIDSRPSDAVALALRVNAPIFVDSQVLNIATYPDFTAVRKDEMDRELNDFRSFLDTLTPEDFLADNKSKPDDALFP